MNFGIESETVEFKQSTGELHQAIEAIAAILNKHGYGELYFGVDDHGELKGQAISDNTIKTVTDGILRDIEPRITPMLSVETYDGKDILKVIFSGSQKPYSAFGKFQIRVGTQNRQMTMDELRRLIKNEDYSFPWEREPSNMSLEDIDDESLKKYYGEAVNCGRLEMPEYDKESLLTILDLMHDNVLNNAALAMFGKNVGIGLKLACYATDEKITFTDLNYQKGNVYSLINIGVSYVLNHINWKVTVGRKREEIPEIPVNAIREIIVNAFAHAMYAPIPEIEINIHPGKITVFNPGTFPDGLTPEDFVDKNISSVKRNPVMLDVLYRCKDVEKSGTGFKRMNALCNNNGVKWDSLSTPYGFYFNFYRVTSGTLIGILSEPVDVDFTDDERQIYMMIKNDSKVTREKLAEAIGKSTRTVQRITDKLTNSGYLIRVGNNRFGYWEVLK